MAVRLPPLHQKTVAQLPLLRALARSLTRNPREADDLVQETLAKAIAEIGQFSPEANLRTRLCAILRKRFYTAYYRQTEESEPGEAPDVGSHARQAWPMKLRAVDGALNQLPIHQREAVMLVGGAGMSEEEAAEVCECAPDTIRSRFSHGRTALCGLLDSAGDGEFLQEPGGPAAPHAAGGSPPQR